jgi:hypothetical protein
MIARRAFILLSLLVLALVGCGPRWVIRQQAAPNPLTGVHKFNLEGMHWEGLMVGGKSEADYLSGKDADQVKSFQGDKAGFQDRFVAQLLSRAQGLQLVPTPPGEPGLFTVRATVNHFEPGFYAYAAARDSEVDITIQIVAQDGKLIDEITIHSRIAATMTSPASGGRMRSAGEDLGNVTGKYLLKRTGLDT